MCKIAENKTKCKWRWREIIKNKKIVCKHEFYPTKMCEIAENVKNQKGRWREVVKLRK